MTNQRIRTHLAGFFHLGRGVVIHKEAALVARIADALGDRKLCTAKATGWSVRTRIAITVLPGINLWLQLADNVFDYRL